MDIFAAQLYMEAGTVEGLFVIFLLQSEGVFGWSAPVRESLISGI
jgi:hypothetical protein